MKTYSLDLRERVVAAVDRKEGAWAAIAARFRVSRAWVGKLLSQRRRTGSIAPRPRHASSPPALDAAALRRLRAAVGAAPDATPQELRAAARLPCGPSTVRRADGLHPQKKSLRASEQDREDVAASWEAWRRA
jgi:transposase